MGIPFDQISQLIYTCPAILAINNKEIQVSHSFIIDYG